MRRLLLLVGAIVLVDTMFFAALTPLLPHYVDDLGLSKAGAGVLSAAYALGAFVAAVPSGIVAARLGVKTTVLVGLTLVAATTVAFGFAHDIWVLDLARFSQGLASSFSWTGALVWLLGAAPANRRGALIGTAMSAAIGGALLGPVLGGVASLVGTGVAFSAVAALELVLAAWAIRTPAARPEAAESVRDLVRGLRDRRLLLGVWLVMLPAALFGTLTVLGPLRLDRLGFGAIGIGATFLVAASFESVVNPVLGRVSDRRGRLIPLRGALVAAAVAGIALPWLHERWLLAGAVVLAAGAFGAFWAPAMSLVSDRAEELGLGHPYGFALINLAWAPGATLGSAAGGSIARASSDAVPYLGLAAACLVTLVAVSGSSETASPVVAER